MKKPLAVLMVWLLLACSLTACGREGEMNQESEASQGMGGTAVVNPIKQVTYEELVETTGIAPHIPEEATDVVYTTIALEPIVAQATFTLDGQEVCLRAIATDALEAQDISGLYYQWEMVEMANAVFVELQGDAE